MKVEPEIKKILDNFPGVSIHSITKIGETVDEYKSINIEKKIKEN